MFHVQESQFELPMPESIVNEGSQYLFGEQYHSEEDLGHKQTKIIHQKIKRRSHGRNERKIQQNIYRDIFRKVKNCQYLSFISIPIKYFEKFISESHFLNTKKMRKKKYSSCFLTFLGLFTKQVNILHMNSKYCQYLLHQISSTYKNIQQDQNKDKINYYKLKIKKITELLQITQKLDLSHDQNMLKLFCSIKRAGSLYQIKQNQNDLKFFKQFQALYIQTTSMKSLDEMRHALKKKKRPKNKQQLQKCIIINQQINTRSQLIKQQI